MEAKDLSCVDCSVRYCRGTGDQYPAFCQTTNMNMETKEKALACYEEPENQKLMKTAAEVESEGYLRWTRVQETVEFAKRMGYKKIGIASCIGLLDESRILTQILRSHGFEVFGIACKAGAVAKADMGMAPSCNVAGKNICNPILQAKLLNEAGTDLNIVVGLCVGHDSLFYKYSEGITTTLIVKDRVLGHNPAAALYTANSYYKKLKGDL